MGMFVEKGASGYATVQWKSLGSNFAASQIEERRVEADGRLANAKGSSSRGSFSWNVVDFAHQSGVKRRLAITTCPDCFLK